jgi:starvation-inducible DNA-binding protein
MATETKPRSGRADEQPVVDQLNLMVAVAADLRSQVKQAHWNVVGPNFIALHRLFDEQATILLAHVDLYAERVRALQSSPKGTVRQAAECSTLDEFPMGEVHEEEAVRLILDRFEQYSRGLTDAMKQAEDAEDLTTQDIFIEGQQQADLQAYFLRSHLPAGRAR